jgi:hypothetical protein
MYVVCFSYWTEITLQFVFYRVNENWSKIFHCSIYVCGMFLYWTEDTLQFVFCHVNESCSKICSFWFIGPVISINGMEGGECASICSNGTPRPLLWCTCYRKLCIWCLGTLFWTSIDYNHRWYTKIIGIIGRISTPSRHAQINFLANIFMR